MNKILRLSLLFSLLFFFISKKSNCQETINQQLKVIQGGSGSNFYTGRVAGFRGSDSNGNAWVEIWSDDSKLSGLLMGNPTDQWQGRINWDDTNNHLEFFVNQVRQMTLKGNGNLGVGTSSVDSRLHVYNGSSGANPHSYSDLTVEDDDHGMITILTPNNKNGYYGFADTNDGFVGGIQYDHSNDRMIFRVNDHVNDMTISNNGNVGIGTGTPDAKLTVAGNINACEVKVEVNAGADFIFGESYQPITLKELESYIYQHKHLPDIAPASEMEANGIQLAEMNIKLLQKIEELTLYTIDQENRLEKLEGENQVLKQKNIKMETIIEQLQSLQNRIDQLEKVK
mgnify:CR=1 FL=1